MCEERTFTLLTSRHYSNKTAIISIPRHKKGDPVMLILKRRYEFWFCILALHRLGAVGIPATHLLTKKDIEYRNNAASIKMIVSTDDEEVMQHVDDAHADSPTLKTKVCLFGKREGWRTFHDEFESFSDVFERPTGSEDVTTKDTMLIYFTSGTTGMPKMVQHNFAYPLGHIITAKYWQNVEDNDSFYIFPILGGQSRLGKNSMGNGIWGSAVFVYDFNHRFEPTNLCI